MALKFEEPYACGPSKIDEIGVNKDAMAAARVKIVAYPRPLTGRAHTIGTPANLSGSAPRQDPLRVAIMSCTFRGPCANNVTEGKRGILSVSSMGFSRRYENRNSNGIML